MAKSATSSIVVIVLLGVCFLRLIRQRCPVTGLYEQQQPGGAVTTAGTRAAAASTTGGAVETTTRSGDNDSAEARALRKMGMEPIYDGRTVKDPWKATLFQRLDRIRVICGDLCRMNDLDSLRSHQKVVETSHLPMIEVPDVDCDAILGSDDIDAGDDTVPDFPEELIEYYTFGRTAAQEPGNFIINKGPDGEPVEKRNNLGVGKKDDAVDVVPVWSEDKVNGIVELAKTRKLKGTYGYGTTKEVIEGLANANIAKDKSILVIGSQHPWLEAILLSLGAAKTTTLEYREIIFEHPKMNAMTPAVFRRKYLDGTLEKFDVVVSWSSLEHSGLGRYGDALNPWADILAATRAWCVTKPGGYMYLGLPVGRDSIHSNWHRIYGEHRWPLIAANWKPLSKTDGQELRYEPSRNPKHAGYLFQK